MNRYLFLPLLMILLFSCNSSQKQVGTLTEEVMEIHDKAMARTTDIYDMKKVLQGKMAVTSDSAKIFDLIKKLDNADEAMLVWMDEYDAPAKDTPSDKAISYLNDQKSKITSVSSQINTAIEEVQSYLAKVVDSIERENNAAKSDSLQ